MGYTQNIDFPAGGSTLQSAYTAGAGSFVLAAGTGTLFGTPTAINPLRFTVASAAAPSTCTHYQCTGISTDTLTGVTTFSGTDRNYSAGDTVYCSSYREDFNDLRFGVAPIAVASGAFDCSTGNWFSRTLTGSNGTITVANLAPGNRVRIDLTQDATGGRTVTWSIAGAIYIGSTAPVMTSTALATDIYEVDCQASGIVFVYPKIQNIIPSTVTWTRIGGNDSRTNSVTYTITAVGNLLVVGFANGNNRGAKTFTDTLSNSYSSAIYKGDTVGGGSGQIAWAQATTSGATTITGSAPYGYMAMSVDEFHPSISGTISLDNANASQGSGTSAASGNVTISGNDDLVVSILTPEPFGISSGGANTPVSPFTLAQALPTPSSGNIGIASAYQLNVASGPANCAWNLPDGNHWVACVASFKKN